MVHPIAASGDAQPMTPASDDPDCLDVGSSDAELIEADLLIEDVSIDGMCGVY